MDPPACVLIDDDPALLNRLTRDLQHRFDRDYELVPVQDAQGGLATLERLRTAGGRVALVVADLQMADVAGVELLCRARSLHPLAKRALLIDYLDFHRNESMHRALTLGQADCWLTRPWDPPDRLLYPKVGELLGEWLEDVEPGRFANVLLLGERRSRRSHQLRDLLDRHGVQCDLHTVDTVEGRDLLHRANRGLDRLPVAVLLDGRVLVQPTDTAMITALGARARPGPGRHDVVIVGAGPAGLSAAVSAASEGLRTVLIEREAFGGQAGTSSRIRNYLGFPGGVSGRDLMHSAREQAALFGTEMVYGDVIGLWPQGRERVVLLRNGSLAAAGAVVLATGVTYRRLGIPAVERFVGTGAFYGAAVSEAPVLRGEDVVVVGGGNSAGQAAVHLSRFAGRVLLVARGETLAESMSEYLLREIESLENVMVRLRTRVVDAAGTGRLERVTLATTGCAPQQVPASALFVLTGTQPRNEWVAPTVERDSAGFILTGRELTRARPSGAEAARRREPYPFESSLPGAFAVGDVRANSVKRIAAGVGEGAQVIQMVHEYLRNPVEAP